MELKLHSYWRSSASWRVRIILNLKELEYTLITVNLLKGEQLGQEYSLVNPDKTLPALEAGNEIITQSTAIIEFLEEIYPQISIVTRM